MGFFRQLELARQRGFTLRQVFTSNPSPGVGRFLFLRLLFFFQPYWIRVIEAAACMVFSTVLALPMPLFSIYIIDHIIVNHQEDILHLVCAVLGTIVILGMVLSFLQHYLLLIFTRRVFFDIELKLFQKIHSVPLSYLKAHASGYIATRISDDVRQLGSMMAGAYIEGLSSITVLVAATCIMFTINPELGLAVLVVLPGIVAVNFLFGRKVQVLSDQVQERKGVTNAVRLESLESAHVVRAFDREKLEARRLVSALHSEFDADLSRNVTMTCGHLVQVFLYALGGILLLWYGTYAIMRDELTLGEFMAFNMLVSYIYGPIGQLTGIYLNFKRGVGVLKRVFEVLDVPEEKGRGGSFRSPAKTGKVVIEDLHFGYIPQLPVLKGVNLVLEPGKISVVVGPSGSGKTTLVHLLLRLYEPISGRMLLDGYDFLSYDVRVLRRNVALVEQNLRLFPGTIWENIAYGKPGATKEEVLAAAESTNCMEFINRFPARLETRLGGDGVQLSAGQKQRVSLARALIRDPRLLVLDEGTASLDPRAENLVGDSLRRAAQDRTTLLVAHRLSTVLFADRIFVLVGGRIVEEGTLQELLRTGGHFTTIYEQNLKKAG